MKGNENKIILDLCGGTGSWAKPYKDAGYKVIRISIPEWDVNRYKFGTRWTPKGIERTLIFYNSSGLDKDKMVS